jgi:hypothetical protein
MHTHANTHKHTYIPRMLRAAECLRIYLGFERWKHHPPIIGKARCDESELLKSREEGQEEGARRGSKRGKESEQKKGARGARKASKRREQEIEQAETVDVFCRCVVGRPARPT